MQSSKPVGKAKGSILLATFMLSILLVYIPGTEHSNSAPKYITPYISSPPNMGIHPISTVDTFIDLSQPIRYSEPNNGTLSSCFLTLGDWGTNDEFQKAVADQLQVAADVSNPLFIISLGDNFYDNGVVSVQDEIWKTFYEDYYAVGKLEKILFFSILGNHDYRINPYAQVAYHYFPNNTRWYMPNFWFYNVLEFTNAPVSLNENPFASIKNVKDYKDPIETQDGLTYDTITVTVIYIDTQLLETGRIEDKLIPFKLDNEELRDLQLEQIEDILKAAQGKSDWIMMCGHYPIVYAKPQNDLKVLKSKIAPLLQKYNVDAFFNGHKHYLGYFKENVTTHITNGAGGRDINEGVCDRPECVFISSVNGFSIQYLTKEKMYTGFFDTHGNMIFTEEQEAIVKNAPQEQVDYPLIQRIYFGPFPFNSLPNLQIWKFFGYGVLASVITLTVILFILFAIRHYLKQNKKNTRHKAFFTNDPNPLSSDLLRKSYAVHTADYY